MLKVKKVERPTGDRNAPRPLMVDFKVEVNGRETYRLNTANTPIQPQTQPVNVERNLAAYRKQEEERMVQEFKSRLQIQSKTLPAATPASSRTSSLFDSVKKYFNRFLPRSNAISTRSHDPRQPLNGSNVVLLLSKYFPLENAQKSMTSEEIALANRIRNEFEGVLLDSALGDGSLTYKDEESGDEEYADEENTDPQSPRLGYLYDRDTMQFIVDRYRGNDGEKWTFDRIKHRYKKVKSPVDIMRMEKYLEAPKQPVVIQEIKDELFIQFSAWLNDGHIIRDRDLKNEALRLAMNKGLDDFKASDNFILMFKKKYGIVSRKITRTVTTKAVADIEVLERTCESFRTEIRTLLPNMDPKKLFNTDQAGVQMELKGGRTLAFRGAKQVEMLVQRKNATTHSFTIQPVISADGQLQTPVLICLVERSAPQVFAQQTSGFRFVSVTHSTSGLMSSELMMTWMKDVYLPAAGDGTVLMLDSWGGHNKMKKEYGEGRGRRVEIVTVPKKTTGRLQPLDVYFNRQFKAFYRRLTEMCHRANPDFIVSVRKNIALLLNVTFRQFSAEKFQNMIRYAWFGAGYLPAHPGEFETPEQYCFNYTGMHSCRCKAASIARCARCNEYLCLTHFVFEEHDC